MSTEPFRGSDAISVRELADARTAGKAHTVLDVREARELDICRLEGALHVPMAEVPARTDDLPTNQLLVVICHHGARSQMVVDFLRNPALTTQSTATAASMPGLARSTNRCGAIDSVQPKRKFPTHAAD
jgi:rhodanese-related sulfurtransferase